MPVSEQLVGPPVFVGGTGRSGTTALSRLLGLHGNIHTFRWESQFIVADGGLLDVAAGGFDRSSINDFVSALRGRWFRRTMNEGAPNEYEAGLFVDVELGELEDAISRFEQSVADGVAPLLAESINHRLISDIFDAATLRQGANRWCEKTPRSLLYIPELTSTFPGSTFVHIIRDGRDVASSMVERQFWPVASSPVFPSLAEFRGVVTFEKAMRYWEELLAIARRLAGQAGGSYVEIRLEDLVSDPENTLRWLLAAIGEPFESRLLRFDLSRSNVGRWTADLTEDEARTAWADHGEALLAEGYNEHASPALRNLAPSIDDEYTVLYHSDESRFARIPDEWKHKGHRSIARVLDAGRFYEEDFLSYIRALELDGVYVDVGGYIGTHAIFFAKHCSAESVITVEPIDAFRDLLVANVAMNDLDSRVEVVPFACAAEQGEGKLDVFGRAQKVEYRKLDELVGPDANVALIKVDVEGMESEVVAGASDLLSGQQARVFAEAHDPDALEKIDSALERHGYLRTRNVFNGTPTYEYIPPGAHSLDSRDILADHMLSHDSHAGLALETDAGEIVGRASLARGERSFLGQEPPSFGVPPVESAIPSKVDQVFVQARFDADSTLRCAIFVVQYSGNARTFTDRVRLHPQTFHPVEIDAATTSVRIAVRFGGTGEFRLTDLRLHYRLP